MAVGLRWHYDVTGAEPIIRDTRVYNVGALSKGTAMCSGAVATAENQGAAIIAAGATLSNIIGVLQEDLTAAEALGVVATGVDKYAKLIINPFAVWLTPYSVHADDDTVNTVASSTGVNLQEASMTTDHERGWGYITDAGGTTGGFGNLFQIGASTDTTIIVAATSYAANLKANLTSDTFIVLIPPFTADLAGGSVNLSVASGISAMQIEGYNTTAATGAAIILENYIQSSRRSLEPLVCVRHSGNNYAAEDPDFYGDLMFCEHLLCSGAVVNTRVIN